MLSNFSNQSLLAGDDPTRIGSGSQAAQPAGVFQTADSEFMLTIAAEHMYKKFCDKVLERPEPPDYLVVETTGLADPLPVAMTFLGSDLRNETRLDSIITVIDAENFCY